MSKRRHQTTISNARYSGVYGGAAIPFCLPSAKNEMQALWNEKQKSGRSFTLKHTRHTENESIGTTSYLKCHFSENSINPKQVQTAMFIQYAIYLLPLSSLRVFKPVLFKTTTHVRFTSTPQPALAWYPQNVKIILYIWDVNVFFSLRCLLHFGTHTNGCQWDIDDKSAFKLIKILPTNSPLRKTLAPKMNENVILFARHY